MQCHRLAHLISNFFFQKASHLRARSRHHRPEGQCQVISDLLPESAEDRRRPLQVRPPLQQVGRRRQPYHRSVDRPHQLEGHLLLRFQIRHQGQSLQST